EQGKPGIAWVARAADRPEVHRLLAAAEAASARTRIRRFQAGPDRAPVPKAGRSYHPFHKDGGWWVAKADLVLSHPSDVVLGVLAVVAPEPRRGVLTLLDQPAFGIGSLPPLPRRLTGFTVLSIDPAKTYDQIIALVKTANPQAADQVPAVEEAFRQQFGFDLR